MKLDKENTKVIQSSPKKGINIGIIIFGIILIYLIATIFLYITAPHVTAYEVRQGSILKDYAYTGLAIRDEMIVFSDEAGYANYYVENNSKIRVGTKIYTISKQKLQFKQEEFISDIALSEQETNALYRKIQSYKNQFSEEDFFDTYRLKDELKNSLDKHINQSKTNQLEAMLASGEYSDIKTRTSSKDGVIVFSVDGMEELSRDNLTTNHFKKEDYKRTDFVNNRKIKSGDPIYKVITNDSWSLVFEISNETKEILETRKNVKVNFKKDNQELRGSISFIEGREKPILCLNFNNAMIRYANDRYLDIELILEDETGLKIPKSAETQKDFYVVPKSYLTQGGNSNSEGVLLQTENKNGETITQFMPVTVYYEEEESIYLDPNAFENSKLLLKPDSKEIFKLKDTKSLKGVFCINRGYAVFKQIQILCESDEYYIIEEGNSFGLSNYDHIALDSKSIDENDVVF